MTVIARERITQIVNQFDTFHMTLERQEPDLDGAAMAPRMTVLDAILEQVSRLNRELVGTVNCHQLPVQPLAQPKS
jgi:hypothetical protein